MSAAQTNESKPAVDNPVSSEKSQESQESKTNTKTNTNEKRMSWTEKAKAGFENLGSKLGRKNEEKKANRLSMEGLLMQARISFEKWVNLHNPFEYPMPNGIVFLTSVKGSLGWGAEMGTGIVFYRLPSKKKINNNNNNNINNINNELDEKENDILNENSEWSGPCAIGSAGLSWGLQIGISKIDHIIMLPAPHHVRTFTSQGQFKLGGSSELTVVNVGMKAQGSVNISDKEISDIHSYSLDTKGLALGVSIEGAIISIRNDCNKAFYGVNVTPTQISDGSVSVPKEKINNEDYQTILNILKKYFKIKPFRVHGPHGPFGPPPHGPHGPGPHPLPQGPGPYGYHPPPHGPFHMPPHSPPHAPTDINNNVSGVAVLKPNDINTNINENENEKENDNGIKSGNNGNDENNIQIEGQTPNEAEATQ